MICEQADDLNSFMRAITTFLWLQGQKAATGRGRGAEGANRGLCDESIGIIGTCFVVDWLLRWKMLS